LANNMWLGAVPFVLAVLTLPERVLVARHYPAAYIVKLYPKMKGARSWNREMLQSGLRGNVSTYRLHSQGITDMFASHAMPPSPQLLAAVIGVTIVGPRNIPERTMRGFLRVRRQRVRDALQWLCANNPLYADVQISTTRLNDLPEDNVPMSILSVVNHSDQLKELHAEHAGYVPDDDDDGKTHCCLDSMVLLIGLQVPTLAVM
jgi:hypothetical protein